MEIQWIDNKTLAFPDVHTALSDPPGLLAAGGDLSPSRLLLAYENGIFPWYEEFLSNGEPSPILWWCPDPRCVLFPVELRIRRSLKKRIRNGGFTLSCDQAFSSCISACALERQNSKGTWINPAMLEAYSRLNELGHAHSIECWRGEELVGGLYGVSIGKMFYGESMFSHEKDTSKIALSYLCCLLHEQGCTLIDCQVSNPHLERLGACNIPIDDFLAQSKSLHSKDKLEFPPETIEASSLEHYALMKRVN